MFLERSFLIACAVAAQTAAARAEDTSPIIVELFTSQGCSACPPADELMAELAGTEDVIPLALHVDYWDYIGWTDSFGNAQFTERQRRYARVAGARSVYTPQFVVSGVDHVVGAYPMELLDSIRRHAGTIEGVDLMIRREGADVVIGGTAMQSFAAPLVVQLVTYDPARDVAIERGENAGKTVSYTNIVTSWREVGLWDGKGPLSLRIAAQGEGPQVVIIQEPGPGLIVAAARVF